MGIESFKIMYQHNLISIGGVRQAVMDGVLTPADYKEIIGEAYEENTNECDAD